MADAARPRLPPGQIVTRKWPVLHYGTVPTVDLSTWRFKVQGAVARPLELGWEELDALPKRAVACDIHCVTRWSRYDNVFGGVAVQELLGRAGVLPEARFALVHAEHGFTTNLPLEDLDRPDNLLALTHDGLRVRDRCVLAECRERGIPVATVMGGGYARDVGRTVEAHCNTVREAAASWREIQRRARRESSVG